MRVGTARVNSDRLGSYEKAFPYGELATASPTSGEKFATYWRDAGTGLDYAVNRYYSPQMGRFLSPDPSMENVDYSNPVSWNMNTYANGDSINFYDPDGLACEDVLLEGWAGIPSHTTVGGFLSQNSDLSIFAKTIFTESRIGWDDSAAYEKAAISATVMNRWQIVNGYYDLYNHPVGGPLRPSQVRTVPDWGRPDGTIGSIVYARNQFAVWSSPGHLGVAAQGRLNNALSSSETSDQCISLLQSIGTVAGFWSARNDHAMYASGEGIVFTSFGSGSGEANKSKYETTIGSFGSSNVFYGVSQSQIWPHGVPLPGPPVPRPRPPKRPKSADR